MTRIEKLMRELSDLYEFYERIKPIREKIRLNRKGEK
jgi:hypothetical protein